MYTLFNKVFKTHTNTFKIGNNATIIFKKTYLMQYENIGLYTINNKYNTH